MADSPEVSSTTVLAQPVDPITPGQRRMVLLLAFVFAALPFFFIGDFDFHGFKMNDLDASAFFFSLGLLPGAIGIVYHIVMASSRRIKGRQIVRQYYDFRNARAATRMQEKAAPVVDESAPDPVGAVAASLFLTGIFLLIAVFAGFESNQEKGAIINGVQGMMYAGLGAYVAVLYYMVARLYSNALSSRFLMTSALRTASAVAIGWVFGIIGVTAFAGAPASADVAATSSPALGSNAVLFLVGLFHNMAIDTLRRRAMKLFGAQTADTDELPITSIEGIDDTSADLLNEYGVSTIQHVATAEPGELCERTLLPLDRIVDWVDQALLIRYLKRNIGVSRALGIRGAVNLAMVYVRASRDAQSDDAKLIASLAEKIGMPAAALTAIAADLYNDYMVGLIYELQQGRALPPLTAPTTTSSSIVGSTTMIPIATAASEARPAV